MHKYYVYCYYDPLTDLPMYIGKGSKNRMLIHWNRRHTHYNEIFKLALLKLDSANLKPVIRKIKTNLDNFQSFLYEHILIKKHGRIGLDEGGILYNRSIGFEYCNVLRDIEDINYDDLKKYYNDTIHYNTIVVSEEEKEEICNLYQSKCIGICKLSRLFLHGASKIKDILLERSIIIRKRGGQSGTENSMFGSKRGYNNHFGGKTHTKGSKKLISISLQNKPKLKIKVNKDTYESVKEASAILGIPITTLRRYATHGLPVKNKRHITYVSYI